MKKPNAKLRLSTQTLRALTDAQTESAAGGIIPRPITLWVLCHSMRCPIPTVGCPM